MMWNDCIKTVDDAISGSSEKTGGHDEADACADKVKKILCDTQILHKADTDAIMFNQEQQRHAIGLKIGDALRYCATLARDIDMTLEEVAELNIAKINSRKQRGKNGGSGDNR